MALRITGADKRDLRRSRHEFLAKDFASVAAFALKTSDA
jgi:hypothetical protein